MIRTEKEKRENKEKRALLVRIARKLMVNLDTDRKVKAWSEWTELLNDHRYIDIDYFGSRCGKLMCLILV